jgi:hypothetical protein
MSTLRGKRDFELVQDAVTDLHSLRVPGARAGAPQRAVQYWDFVVKHRPTLEFGGHSNILLRAWANGDLLQLQPWLLRHRFAHAKSVYDARLQSGRWHSPSLLLFADSH